MIKNTFYPNIGQSFLLILMCFILQIVTGIIVYIIFYAGQVTLPGMYIATLWLSQACIAFTVLYGIHRSKISIKEYLTNRVHDKKAIILSILFFIGIYFAASLFSGLLENFMPSNSNVDAALTQGFNSLAGIFVMVVIAPVFEELLFRGVILRGFLKNYSIAKSLIITSLLFGLLHFNLIQSITAVILGLALGWIFIKTGSLWMTIFLHSLNNGISVLLYQLTVKNNVSDSQLIYVVLVFLIAGAASFLLLRRMPDNISHIIKERDNALSLVQEREATLGSGPQYLYNEPLKHSGFGIASFIISIVTWCAGAASIGFTLINAFVFEGFKSNIFLALSSDLAVSSIAAVLGLILGIAGAANKHRKKVFPVLGIIFNIFIILWLVFILFIILYINRAMPAGGINL